MSIRNKRLLRILLVIVALVLVVRVPPLVQGLYAAKKNDLAELEKEIQRSQQLLERADTWQERAQRTRQAQQNLAAQLFEGETPELIGARVQAQLKKLANKAGMNVESLSLPEVSQSDDWLLLTQGMSFRSGSQALISLLRSMREAHPRLTVTELDLRVVRSELSGSLKAVGFGHLGEPAGAKNGGDADG